MDHRVLVIDDEPSILFAMTEYFGRIGHRVDSAHDATEALLLLAAGRYSLVIADLRLTTQHQSDGLDLLAYIRKCFPGTRTILLTAYGAPETTDEARRIGVDAILDKSHDLAEIAAIVERLMPRMAR